MVRNLFNKLFRGPPLKLSKAEEELLKRWSTLEASSVKKPLDNSRLVVVDVETTGLDTTSDRLLSIGAVTIQNGKLTLGDNFHGVLLQDQSSSEENILVHRISGDAQLSGEAPVKLLLRWLEYCGKDSLVAYHAPFDQRFLQRSIRQVLGVKFSNLFLDLAWVLPGLFPEAKLKRKPLDAWLSYFQVPVGARHSADADALATATLLLLALERAKSKGISSVRDLSAIEREEIQMAHRGP